MFNDFRSGSTAHEKQPVRGNVIFDDGPNADDEENDGFQDQPSPAGSSHSNRGLHTSHSHLFNDGFSLRRNVLHVVGKDAKTQQLNAKRIAVQDRERERSQDVEAADGWANELAEEE